MKKVKWSIRRVKFPIQDNASFWCWKLYNHECAGDYWVGSWYWWIICKFLLIEKVEEYV